ncbi:hypothetical protein G3A39_43170 [Paraburkholderia aspalathi]|nr:hypothetical protein [Paraburkholderia aspalathi]
MIKTGERLWNGAIVSADLARTYNQISAKIDGLIRDGKPAPDNLLNGRHNLLNFVPVKGA